MNGPSELYALGLTVLMDRQNVHHFEIDLEALDSGQLRGLALNARVENGKVTFSTGRCRCPACTAAAGETH